ncbi:MAG: CHAD domain-containing protein [Phycisphaerales bacterium]
MATKTTQFDPQSPACDAARKVVRARLKRLRSILADGPATDADAIHQLRVSTRRTEAALGAFGGVLRRGATRRVRARLAMLRRAAGRVRDADVRAALLGEVAAHAGGALRETIEELVEGIGRERARAEGRLRERCRRVAPDQLRLAWRRVRRRADPPPTVVDAARACVAGLAAEVRALEGATDAEDLHELRLAIKKLRYGAEVFADALPALGGVAGELARLQTGLGSCGDAAALAEALRPLISASRPQVAALVGRAEALRDRRLAEAQVALADGSTGLTAVLARVERAVAPPRVAALPAVAGVNGQAAAVGSRRCAAIDVGTNSIRLLVAEVRDDGTHRVLDDEREASRLGAGLSITGRLEREAMGRSASAIARMRTIAEGYGARPIRVIGTAACRLAKNADEFAALVRDVARVELEVISEEDEARLAFASVAASFDLAGRTVAVVDIGGGSTEVVIATNGVPEVVRSVPLGAVSLTDRHGGSEAVAGRGYQAMRRRVDRALLETVERPTRPELVIGTGGTFTTLAAMLVHRESGSADSSLWDRPIAGLEATRADAKHMLERLRSLSEAERERVPGLPRERADIIVAGVSIVDRVLKHLGVNLFRVHDKGVRDGLVIAMAREMTGSAIAPPDAMASVRRFAEACRYEREHSEHVTKLALSMFDQLMDAPCGPRVGDRSQARRVLEAAGVLHDIGYLVNYAKHHKHGYHLILHSDLPGWTNRDIRVVANVARYHRRAEPKAGHSNFASLPGEDQELVRLLAGVLRVADGLDRTHMQRVRGVRARIEDGVLMLDVEAEGDASVDVWGSQAKSGLLERELGVRVRLARRAEDGVAGDGVEPMAMVEANGAVETVTGRA